MSGRISTKTRVAPASTKELAVEENVKEIEPKTIIISNYDLIDENGYCYNQVILSHEVVEMHNEFALMK